MSYFTTQSTDTARLNNKFDKISKWHYNWWKFAGLGETLRTNLGLFDVLVAPEASTRGENFNLVEGADHFSICRPRNKFAEVFTTIENGPLVVLLHGGVGKGKITLAKYVCEYYQQQKEVRNIFEHVHFEFCGYGSGPDDALSKMGDIMRILSPTSLDNSWHKEESGWRSRITSAYHEFFRDKKVLIILDNVLNEGFLYEMWKVAQGCPHVRYLVTSQLPYLCHNLTTETQCIAMRRTTADEARKILATRAGMESGIIPSHLQPIVDQAITATEGNPHALACLAEQFNISENKIDRQAWWDAYNNLPTVLNAEERTVVLGLHYGSPRRSLWTAMELCIKSLETCNAKVLFFLIYACRRARISEEILQIWYDCINTSGGTYLKSREELHSRELLEPNCVELGFTGSQLKGDDSDQKLHMSTEWSLRPLVKLYMEHQMAGKIGMIMRKEIMHAMGSLFGAKKLRIESGMHPIHLRQPRHWRARRQKWQLFSMHLYFDSSHVDHLVTDLAMRARTASKVEELDYHSIHRRREAIETILWSLAQPKHEEWIKPIASSARKVFLTYICERQLDGDGLSTLLKFEAYPPAQLATLSALLSIFTVEETPLPWQHARPTLKALLALLDSNRRFSTSVQEAASKALVPMLEILFRFISPNNPADLQLQSALALSVLTAGHEASIGKKLVKEDGAVAGLVKSWSQHGKSDWEEQVIGALYNLARQNGDSIKLAIVYEEGVLAALLKVLVEHNNGNLQELAAAVLQQLASCIEQSIKSRIGNEKGAIAGLVKCFSVEDKPGLQQAATAALRNILPRNGPNKVAVANEPGALAALAKLVSEHDNGIVQENAAQVIWNLIDGREGNWDWIRTKISNEGGIIALVKALYVQENPDLQETAAGALASLACGEDSGLSQTIANERRQ